MNQIETTMSHKKSYRELRESIRNEVCKSYTRRIEYLQKSLDIRRKELKLVEKERDAAIEKLREAEDKLQQYEDWIERLCDYCNLSDRDRQLLLERRLNVLNEAVVSREMLKNGIFNFLNNLL